MPKRLNIKKGDKYSSLVILKEVERHRTKSGEPKRAFLCECKCGNRKIVMLNDLRTGKTISCGCIGIKNRKKASIKHGMRYTKFYKRWMGMIRRCEDKKHKSYYLYGGRGIKVNKKWLNFNEFKKDMYDSYKEHCKKHGLKQTSLERINNNGNYEFNNCKWATWKEQGKNKRNNKLNIKL